MIHSFISSCRLPSSVSGKSKIILPLQKRTAIVKFKDDISAFNGKKQKSLPGKGSINAQISAILFDRLSHQGVPNHFHGIDSQYDCLCDFVDMIPLEVVVRLKAWGSIINRLGIDTGISFDDPLVELYYKREDLEDPFINSHHAKHLGLVTRFELNQIYMSSVKTALILQRLFRDIDIDLIDIKLEFGRFSGQILLSDELSPDNMRLHDLRSNGILDKDLYRYNLGDVLVAYRTVLERLRLTETKDFSHTIA